MSPSHKALGATVDELSRQAIALGAQRGTPGKIVLPSQDVVVSCQQALRSVFFPGYFGSRDLHEESLHYYIGATLDRVVRLLEGQILRGLAFTRKHDPHACRHCEERAAAATRDFVTRLPHVRALVGSDVEAAYDGDPALRHRDEAIFTYPGVSAIVAQRLAHELFKLEVPIIPRMITEHAHSATGIDLHPGATIGERFFIDHGTGVVVGETAVIGDRVTLYQGVTLGARSFPLDAEGHPIKGIERHPIVEDDVVIYAGATILGRITIGRGSTIGGNVWLTNSVAPGSRVTQAVAKEGRFEHGGGI